MQEPSELQFDTDFNLEDEYKPAPLCPQGVYRGHTTRVTFDPEGQCIIWNVTLQGNPGTMSDGETPIDGQVFYYRNWLPKSGDENIMTASGRQTKRQAKINMMSEFASKMRIDMKTKEQIVTALSEGLWLGIPVLAKLTIGEYQGRSRNEVSDMTRDTDGEIIAVLPEDEVPF
jgi:hypothetical protein